MKPLLIPITHSCLYWGIAGILSLYYGVRGIFIKIKFVKDDNIARANSKNEPWTEWDKYFIHCGQDFIYNVTGSLAGFSALYVECKVLTSIHDLSTISSGTALFVAFLSIVAVVGIGGVLPPILLMGRLFTKST